MTLLEGLNTTMICIRLINFVVSILITNKGIFGIRKGLLTSEFVGKKYHTNDKADDTNPRRSHRSQEGLFGTLCLTPAKADGYADRSMWSWRIHFHAKQTNDTNRQRGIPTGPTWPCVVYTRVPIWKYLAHHAQRPYHRTFTFPVWRKPPRFWWH